MHSSPSSPGQKVDTYTMKHRIRTAEGDMNWSKETKKWKEDAEAKLKVSPSPMSLDPCKAEKSFKKWNDSSPELPMEVESSTKPAPPCGGKPRIQPRVR